MRVRVAGVGNIVLGDDGFGPEVIRHVAARPDPDGVRIHDYGIGGLNLAYDLLEQWDALILVDAVPDDGAPGELRVFEADTETLPAPTNLDAHSMDPAAVFASLRALGGHPPRTIVVGCQVGSVEDGIGLSDPVLAAVPRAAAAIESAVAMLRSEAPVEHP